MNKIKFRQRLLFKILLMILLATGLTLAIVGFSAYFFTHAALQDLIMKNDLEILENTMDKIDRSLYERYLDIQAIAGEESLGNYLADYTRGQADENKKNSNLKRIKDLSIVTGPWNTLFVIDSDGTIILAMDEGEMGQSLDRWYYKNIAYEKAMKGETNYSDFVILEHTGEPAVVFAAPIRDMSNPQKPIIGAVVGDFTWMAIEQMSDDITVDNVVLFNHSGDVIAGNSLYAGGGGVLNESQSKVIKQELNKEGSKSMIIHRGQGIFPEDMLVSMAIQEGFLSYKGSGWSLVCSLPVRVAFVQAKKAAGRIVLILLPIIILLSGGILFVVHRLIVTPTTLLTQTIRDISLGDLTKQVAIVSNDEIGQLAVAFNDMTQKLRESHENLEEKIKQRTSELRESQEHSRLIIETANDAFVSIDSKGLIIDWNSRAESMFGWPRSEVIGKSLAETIIPPQYREAHKKGLKHFMATGEGPVLGKTVELTALHHSAKEFPVEITIWPIQIIGNYQFNAFLRDISKRKEIENELKRSYQELAEREKGLRQTLADLQKAHEELKQAQAQLLHSEKLASIGQLAAGVAHEINNPVGFINNNMEVLGQYIADYGKVLRMVENLKAAIEQENLEKAKSIVQEMARFEEEINLDYIINDIDNLLQHNQRGLERIQKIVLDLCTFAREDKDTMELVKIEEVIDSILSIVQSELKYKAELKKNYVDTPLVKGNAQRLGQVFVNLLVNAVQAIEEKGMIEIKTYQEGRYVYVDVIDTGKGISPENLRKIFDPFFTSKPVGQGTGLGLSVSYEIVKKHGGEIKVQSEVGKGTTFTVMLPIT